MERSVKISAVFLGLLTVVAMGFLLQVTRSFMMPMFIAIMLSFVLSPLVDAMARIGLPRWIGIVIVIISLLGFLFLVGLFLYSSILSLIRQYPKYQERFIELYQFVISEFNLREFFLGDVEWGKTVGGYLVSISQGFMKFMGYVALILFFLIFMLLEKTLLPRKMIRALKRGMTAKVARIFDHITVQIGRYLTIKLLISLGTGLLVWLAYSIIGLDFAFIWGVLAFMFNFIPNIGSALVLITSFVFSIIQFFPDWGNPLAVAICMLVIQAVMGSFLDPKLSGDSLNLSPVVILFSLFFWGWMWGVVGMFLAVPLTVALKIVFENIPELKPISILMGTGYRKHDPPKLSMQEEELD